MLVFLFLLLLSHTLAQQNLFIDFSAAPGGDGSQNNPCDTISNCLALLDQEDSQIFIFDGESIVQESFSLTIGCLSNPCPSFTIQPFSTPGNVTVNIQIGSTFTGIERTYQFRDITFTSITGSMISAVSQAIINWRFDNVRSQGITNGNFLVCLSPNCSLVVENSLFYEANTNTIINNRGPSTFTNNIFKDNTVEVLIDSDNFDISNNLFINNQCSTGCVEAGGTVSLTNNSFSSSSQLIRCNMPLVSQSSNRFCGVNAFDLDPVCGFDEFILSVPTVCGICTSTGVELDGFDTQTNQCFPNSVISPIVSSTIVVDQSGQGDFTEIGSAIMASSPGTEIMIRPGTYMQSPIILPRFPLTLAAETPGTVFIESTTSAGPFVFVNSPSQTPIVSRSTVIDGLTFRQPGMISFFIISGSYPAFRNINFEVPVISSAALDVQNSYPSFFRCNFSNQVSDAIGVINSAIEVIESGFVNNTINIDISSMQAGVFIGNTFTSGIFEFSADSGTPRRIEIIDNDFSNNAIVDCENNNFILVDSDNRFCGMVSQPACVDINMNSLDVDQDFTLSLCDTCITGNECSVDGMCFVRPRLVYDCMDQCGGDAVLDANDQCCSVDTFDSECGFCNCPLSTDSSNSNVLEFFSLSILFLIFLSL